jgi:YfiH family protein
MNWIVPEWPAPEHIQAISTTRQGGISTGPYNSANFGLNSGDDQARVLANRDKLQQAFKGSPIQWLQQVHGEKVHRVDQIAPDTEADASITRKPHQVCAVLTADCLPVLICDRAGTEVAAVHAGWRGVAQQIIGKTVQQFEASAADLLVWLGPAIGPDVFEVGAEVIAAMAKTLPDHQPQTDYCRVEKDGKFMLDLYTVARLQLKQSGIEAVYGGQWCTLSDEKQFYSYRRDKITGRMATAIQILS